MSKRNLLLTGLVAALLVMSAGSAQAASFVLRLSDGTTTVDINDNDIAYDKIATGDMIQVQAFTIGMFTINATVFTSYSASVPVDMRVGSMVVTSQGLGTLTATLWHTDLTAIGAVAGSSASATVGLTNPAGSVTFTNYVAGTQVFNTTLPGAPSTGSVAAPLLGPGPFSLASQLRFDFTTAAVRQINATSSLNLTGTPAVQPVPEPTTLFLFGPAALGLFGLSYRRRSKRA